MLSETVVTLETGIDRRKLCKWEIFKSTKLVLIWSTDSAETPRRFHESENQCMEQYIWIFCLNNTTKINIQCLSNRSEKWEIRSKAEETIYHVTSLIQSNYCKKYAPKHHPHPGSVEELKKGQLKPSIPEPDHVKPKPQDNWTQLPQQHDRNQNEVSEKKNFKPTSSIIAQRARQQIRM